MTIDPDKLYERIKARTKPRLVREDLGECWEWQGGTQSKGYGTISVAGRNYLVHRVMYAVSIGELEDGMFACHKCDNRICCRPKHLFPGAPADNTRDMREKGRQWVPGQPPKALRFDR